MQMENAEVWCVLAQINDNINIESLQKSEPTIDFCMQKLGSNNIDLTPHSRKWGGVIGPLIPCFRGLLSCNLSFGYPAGN